MSEAPDADDMVDTAVVTTRLALVRHGETVWHEENRYAGGASDIDLTERGLAQARALARWCTRHSYAAVVCSPVRRAVETARPSADAMGLDLQIVDDLREVDFGVAEGRTADELMHLDADMVHQFRADPVAHPYPGSESPDAGATRGGDALRQIAAQYPGATILVVAHNTLLRLAMCRLLGMPVSDYRRTFPRLDNAAVTEVAIPVDPRRLASLVSLNVHLDP